MKKQYGTVDGGMKDDVVIPYKKIYSATPRKKQPESDTKKPNKKDGKRNG